MKRLETFGEQETLELGRRLGRQAKPGEIYCLNGDLGTGKTVFTKGFAEGLGIREPVVSPTFTILQIYEDGRLPLYHFDVYRLSDEEELEEIGCEEYFYGDGVCLIEWAELFPDVIPSQAYTIHLEKNPERGFDYRCITITGPEDREANTHDSNRN